MTSVILKLSEMVLMIIIGYICAKVKIAGPEFNRHTSAVLTKVLLPATILKVMIGIGGGAHNNEVLFVILLFFLMMGIAGVIGKLFSMWLPIPKDERGIMIGVVMYMNITFIGFPLVETYYGSEGMFYAVLSCVPMNLLMFSVGVATISGSKENGAGFKQILNVPMIATLLGIAIMIFSIPIPAVLTATIESVASATIPISMIILGSSLAAIPVKAAVTDKTVYAAVFARLIISPVLTYFILKLFCDNDVLIGAVTILASTPVAVLMTPLCLQCGKSDQLASKSIFISTVFSVFTMPAIIWFLL